MQDGAAYTLEVQVADPAGLAGGGQSDTVSYVAVAGGAGAAEVLLRSRRGETGPVSVTVRLAGAGEVTATLQAAVAGPAAALSLSFPPGALARTGEPAAVTLQTTDAGGVPVPAGRPVELAFTPAVADLLAEGAEVGWLAEGRHASPADPCHLQFAYATFRGLLPGPPDLASRRRPALRLALPTGVRCAVGLSPPS